MKSPLKLLLATGLLWAGLVMAQVNINTASPAQLDSLKGIGPSKAQAIVDYRKKNGPFKSVDDLQKVTGIGPATLKDLRGEISVSGTTRAPTATSTSGQQAAPAMPKQSRSATDAAATPTRRPEAPPPVTQEAARPAAPARPAMPKRDMPEDKPRPAPAPAPASTAKPLPPSVVAAPPRPAMPGMAPKPDSAPKPATATNLQPAAPAMPARPAAPAKPAQPARPAAVN